MTKTLLILGAGGHGRVVADAAFVAGFEQVAFLDDGIPADNSDPQFPVLGPIAALGHMRHQWPDAIAAVGNNAVRLDVFERLKAAGFRTPPIVHPSAVISPRATIERGVFVAAGVVVNIGAVIREAAILNTGSTIDHDCVIGRAAHVSPGVHLGGTVTVGARSWIGIGTSVRNNITIGDDAVVGAGSAVVSDIGDHAKAIGVPARTKEQHQ